MNKIKRLFTWVEVVAWISLILYLSGESFSASRTWIALNYWVDYLRISVNSSTLHQIHFAIRKSAHFTEFFVLGLLLFKAFRGTLEGSRSKVFWWVAGAGLICALGDEAHQLLFMSRTPSLWDSLLDFSGVLASQFFIALPGRFSQSEFARAGRDGPSAAPEESR
jgi:VanZ family protein